jgi:hypothetical protein
MKTFLKVCLAISVFAVAGYFGFTRKTDAPVEVPAEIQIHEVAEQPVGASIPVVVSKFETSLQSKITTSDTSMTLVSGTDRNGTALSGFICFTIDENSSNVEYVCGTASSTSITSMTRGIDPITGTSSVTSLKKSHNRGASVKITDYPALAIVSRVLNGNETLPNRLVYDSSIATSTFTTYNLVNKQYVDGVTLQGAPTATSTTPGVVQLASGSELSAGTAQSGAYTLVPRNSFFNFTPQAATTVPVTNAAGKLAQGFLDLTASWAFTGTTTLAATTSAPLILNGHSYTYPNSHGSATSSLINNGSGVLTWGSPAVVPGTSATSTKSIDTFYRNSTGRNLLVNITLEGSYTCSGGVGYVSADFKVGAATTSMTTVTKAKANDGLCTNGTQQSYYFPVFMIVPNNYYYTVTGTLGSPSINLVTETPF